LTEGDALCMVVTDLTDQKRREDLQEANRRKDEFLAMLAHELRNPLAPIRNALQILRLPGVNAEIVEQAKDVMDRQLRHMVRLVDDLLDVSRITRGKVELRKERVDLTKIIQSAVETSRPLIEASGHELKVQLAPEPIWLEADLTRLAQVLSNLLNNSARYTKPNGRILLTSERREGEALVRVCDNGLGIPEDMLPLVFEMFTQVDRPQERSQGGLGIGLSLDARRQGGSPQRRPRPRQRIRRAPAAADGGAETPRGASAGGPNQKSYGPARPAHSDRGRQPRRRRQPGPLVGAYGQ
jgi:signal transduction histidine kinase